jgi:hypothetical protein
MKSTTSKPVKWARSHKQCKVCLKTDYKHYQKGYCLKCFSAYRYKKYKAYYKKYAKTYWAKNRVEILAKNKERYLNRINDQNNNPWQASISKSDIQNNQ